MDYQIEDLETMKALLVYATLPDLLDGLGEAEGIEHELIVEELRSRGIDADQMFQIEKIAPKGVIYFLQGRIEENDRAPFQCRSS